MVVDDDNVLRKLVSEQVARMGFDSTPAASGEEALAALAKSDYDVVLLDIRMPGLSGLDTLREIRKVEDAPEVIMLTADTSLGTGLEAMRLGAYDYLTKPATLDEIEAVVRKADEKRRLVRQNASLRDAVRQPSADEQSALVYRSKALEGLVALAETAARADSTVIITGESGTGKDVLARFIHARSARSDSPMISVNCAALPETLFESEFFGHERGAFTGATATKRGLIEAADGSTLLLDEVGEMPLQTQVKLLQFLEEGRFRRVGSTRDCESDVRVIAATNRTLADEVSTGRFRADLFYRLNVISLHVPPLRQRREDIPALVEHFLTVFAPPSPSPTRPGNVSRLTTGPATSASYATRSNAPPRSPRATASRPTKFSSPSPHNPGKGRRPRPTPRPPRSDNSNANTSSASSKSRAATASAPPPSSASAPARSTESSASMRPDGGRTQALTKRQPR